MRRVRRLLLFLLVVATTTGLELPPAMDPDDPVEAEILERERQWAERQMLRQRKKTF